MLAIHAQERGLAFPHAAVFAARYKVQRSWGTGLAEDFARNGLLRKIGALYVTGAPRADEAPTS